MSLANRVAQNFWLIGIARDAATVAALKGKAAPLPDGERFGRLRLRGLAGPVLFRPAATDVKVVWELFHKREYQFVPGGWPFQTVVDCGANVGMFMAWVLRTGGASVTRYVGVEPDVDSFELLREQVRSQSFDGRATLFQAAVWERDGSVSFDDTGASWSHHVSEGGGGRAVRAMTVGTILDEAKLPSCDLLKLDIEGGERQVLAALRPSAARVDALVAELHQGLDYRWFADVVSAAGFLPAPAGKLFRLHPGAVRRGGRFERFAPR